MPSTHAKNGTRRSPNLAVLALVLAGCGEEDPTTGTNHPPVAVAGPDRNIPKEWAVTLDGSGSSDPDGDELQFAWRQTSGPAVILMGADRAMASFGSPSQSGPLAFELRVSDGSASSSDTVELTVVEGNAPAADAGDDRFASPGQTVTLRGSGQDPDGDDLSFTWTQAAGAPVSLSGAETTEASFVAPGTLGELRFRFTVSDGSLEASDEVTVTITDNAPPIADAGLDFSAPASSTVELNGAASSDPEQANLAFRWRQTAGPMVTLAGAALARPSFTAPPENGTLVFELVVNDGSLDSEPDEVSVNIVGYGGQRAVFERHPFRLDTFVESIDPRELIADGEILYVADGTTGLGVYDVSDPENPTRIGGDPTPIVDFALSGSIVSAIGTSGELVVIDVSTPAAPSLVSMRLGGRPLRFSASPTAGFTLLDTGDIVLSDLSNADRPVAGRIPAGSNLRNVLVATGGRLYVGTGVGLEIYEVSDLANPSLLGGVSLSGGVDALDVVGTTVYADGGQFTVIDAANAAAPSTVGSTSGSSADAIDVDQGLAVLSLGFGGIRVIDVSNPMTPTERSTYDTGFAENARVVAGRAYVPTSNSMEIVDLTDPSNPADLGTYNARLDTVEIIGTHAIGFQYQELFVIDVSNPATPSLTLSQPFGSYSQGATLTGTTLYTWDHEGTVFVIDVSAPTAPLDLGRVLIPLRLSRVAGSGAFAYATYDQNAENRKGVQVYDLASPSAPQVRSNFVVSYAEEIAVFGVHAFVSRGSEGVVAIDYSNPASPLLFAETNRDGGPRMVARDDVLYSLTDDLTIFDFRGGGPADRTESLARDLRALSLGPEHLFVSGDFAGGSVAAYDLSNPFLIRHEWSRTVPSQSTSVASNGSLVFVGSPGRVTLREFTPDDTPDPLSRLPSVGGSGAVVGDRFYVLSYSDLNIYDVSADQPALLGTIPVGPYGAFVSVDGERVYVGTSQRRVIIVDVSDPTMPSEVGTYTAGAAILALDASADLLAVGTSTGGLELVDVSAPESPRRVGVHGQTARSVELVGSYAYADLGPLFIIDVSNPALPRVVTTILDYRGPVFRVGDQHIVMTGYRDLALFDITNPASPVRQGSIAAPTASTPLGATAEYLVVALYPYGNSFIDCQVIDLRDRFLPTLAAELAVDRAAQRVFAHDERLYIHNGTALAAFSPMLDATALDSEFEAVTPGQTLQYTLRFTDRDASHAEEIACQVSAGTCEVTAFDPGARTAALTWTAPTSRGEHELAVAVGNEYYFAQATDRIRVQ